MDKKLREIIISAWLHDVGKFAQRADRTDLYDKAIEGMLCRVTQDGRYTHQHVVYTQCFLEKYRDVLPDGISVPNVIRIAARHHSPSSYEEWIVAQGDRLSSGADRCRLLDMEDSENSAKFYEKPMINILSTLHIEGRKNLNVAYCPLEPLDGDAVLSVAKASSKIGKDEYNCLWEQFEADFIELQGLGYDDFMQSLDSLLERYWWCIPSATNSDTDISLYQHAKTTAAFAAALYEYHRITETENELQTESLSKFRFIKGDISGIQKYIFELKSNDDSAKLLRAKSFEIAALGDILARNIINRLDMPLANIITSAGGNFMLLLPNTYRTAEILPQIQLEAESCFLNEYAGKLAVIISDGVEATMQDVQQKNAQKLINDIGYNADICKQKKMQKALNKNGAVLESFYAELHKNGECSKCGIFPASGKTNGECEHCKSLTKIGAVLVKASYIAYNTEKLQSFGNMVEVSKKDAVNASCINKYIPGRPLAHLPYTAPCDTENPEQLLSFTDIAQKSTGSKKLAMFKADVDNLGLVFSSSSLGERMSFSRFADMSHMLHYFFSAYYTHFVSTRNAPDGTPYKDVIYTVFSGGDDLCVLGTWNHIMHFANDFHHDFEKFTNANPSVTLSAGIALASPSVPVRMIAEQAEKALERSKERCSNGSASKNAVTVFGTTVDWETYKKCLDDGKQMQEYLEQGKLSTGVVYKMIDFANRAQKIKNGNIKELLNIRDATWKSNFCYIVARNVKKEDVVVRDWFLQFGTSIEQMIQSRIAVSYALYMQRNKESSKRQEE